MTGPGDVEIDATIDLLAYSGFTAADVSSPFDLTLTFDGGRIPGGTFTFASWITSDTNPLRIEYVSSLDTVPLPGALPI